MDIFSNSVEDMCSDELSEFFDWRNLNKHQKEFSTTWARNPLAVGAVGSGKTRAAIVRTFNLCSNTPYFGDLAGNVGIIGRLHRTDLEDSTLSDFFELIEPTGWIKNYEKRSYKVTLVNGSTIQFVSMEDWERFLSRNLGFAYFEQIEEIPEKAFDEINNHRLRRTKTLTRKPLTIRTAFGVCNPCENWVYDLWGANEEKLTSKDVQEKESYDPDLLVIHSSTYENAKNLAPDYIPHMEKKYGGKNSKKGKMYLLGMWGSLAGSVYEWDEDFVNEEDIWPPLEWETIMGLDDGWGTNGVISVSFIALEQISRGISKAHCYDELYLEGATPEDAANAIFNTLEFHHVKRLENSFSFIPKVKVSVVGCDPAMRGTQQRTKSTEKKESRLSVYVKELIAVGLNLPLIPSNNNIALGTDRVDWFFRNGLARFNPRCVHHRKSLKNYVWDEDNTTQPKANQDDHPCDSYRYAIMKIPAFYHQPKEEKKETVIERYRRKKEQRKENQVNDLLNILPI